MQKNGSNDVKKDVKTTYNVKEKNLDKFREFLKKQNKK